MNRRYFCKIIDIVQIFLHSKILKEECDEENYGFQTA